MAIDYTGMFTGERPNPSAGVAGMPQDLLGQTLQGVQQGEQRSRQALGQMMGKDLRSPADQAREQLSQVDINSVNTPEGLLQLAQLQQATGDTAGAATLASQANTLKTEQENIQNLTQAKIKNRNSLAEAVEKINPELASAIRSEAGTGSNEALKEGLKAIAPASSSSFSKGLTMTMVDGNDNAYTMTNSFSKETGNMENKYAPIGDSPPHRGQALITTGGEFNMTAAGERERAASATGAATEAQDYAANRILALDSLPDLKASKTDISRARDMLEAVNTGGPINLVEMGLDKFFGKTSADKAELEYTLGLELFKSLKPLFGGIISDTERTAVEEISAGLYRGNPANAGIIKQMLKTLNDGILKAELYRNNKSPDDFARALDGMFRVPEASPVSTGGEVIDISTLPVN